MENPPAFPRVENLKERAYEVVAEGMTLRDYFAARAMQTFIRQLPEQEEGIITRDFIAQQSYYMADAMLKARE